MRLKAAVDRLILLTRSEGGEGAMTFLGFPRCFKQTRSFLLEVWIVRMSEGHEDPLGFPGVCKQIN